ncbi:MAG: alpha/beta hydrolase [Pseudomonadota bacterium]
MFPVFLRKCGLVGLCLLGGCGPALYNEIELMPSPTLHAETSFNPYVGINSENVTDRAKLFYVTDRAVAHPEDPQEFYNNERGVLVRAGTANVTVDPPLQNWEEALRISLSSEPNDDYTLSVIGVEETGVLPFSIAHPIDDPPSSAEMATAGRQFAAQINAKLKTSPNKDIFVYVHGYNVDFDYSTLVSKSLQHFLGYQGAFISYNWAATPSRFAYFRDQESALATRRNLRALIEFLSENTRADKIHLIGYSAGTRPAFEVAYQLALKSEQTKSRMGKLVLISSDLDQAHFLQAIEDGLLETVTDVTVYQSQTDSALALSRFVFGRARIGERSNRTVAGPAARKWISSLDNLHIIDVTDAERASAGNGHWYFQSSPWASSDLMMSLLYQRAPDERGLVRETGEFVWRFPSNYPRVLQSIAQGL